jgi:hypothetical protein
MTGGRSSAIAPSTAELMPPCVNVQSFDSFGAGFLGASRAEVKAALILTFGNAAKVVILADALIEFQRNQRCWVQGSTATSADVFHFHLLWVVYGGGLSSGHW